MEQTAHHGITPLAFALLTAEKEAEIRLWDEADTMATHKIIGNIESSKRKYPLPPSTRDCALKRLKTCLVIGEILFHCT